MANQEIIKRNEHHQRLDKYLRKKFPALPLSLLYRFLRQKKVKLIRAEKKIVGKRDLLLQENDTVIFFFNIESFTKEKEKKEVNYDFILKSKFFKEHFSILAEDEYFFVANKSAGISVHPGSKTPWGKSLIDLYIAYTKSHFPNSPEPKLVHRLDKDTSGLLLISKDDASLRALTELLRSDEVEKKYLALIAGKMKQESGIFTETLLRTEGSKYTKVRVASHADAKRAKTSFVVKKYFPLLNASLVEITLHTGRMHQIRVHFSHSGHPLAGDDAYGNKVWNQALKKEFSLKRQFLHAHSLKFIHPITKKRGAFYFSSSSRTQQDYSLELPEKFSRLKKFAVSWASFCPLFFIKQLRKCFCKNISNLFCIIF
jgi:23S rRNA pseudouridine955/2504/2580 synthase